MQGHMRLPRQQWRSRAALVAVSVGALVAATRSEARADLQIGVERPVDSPIPAPDRTAAFLSTASDGTSFLAGWSTTYPRERVRAARFTAAGEVLDKVPIALPASDARQFAPTIAWDGTAYVVVWGEAMDDPELQPPVDLYAARISADGVLIDGSAAHIATVTDLNYFQATATGGTTLVSWATATGRIQLARLSDGAVLDETPIDVVMAYGAWSGAASCMTASCLIVWSTCPTAGTCSVQGHRIDLASGAFLEEQPLAIAEGYWSRVATDGSAWLVAYRRQDVEGDGGHLAVSLVEETGTATEFSSLSISGPWTSWLNLAFDGTSFVLVWQERRPSSTSDMGGYAIRISPGGALLDPSGGVELPGPPHLGAIGCIGSLCAVPLGNGVVMIDGSSTLALSAPLRVAHASNTEEYPAVAPSTVGFVVAWQDYRNPDTGADIFASFVDAHGLPSGTAFPVAVEANEETTPAVGWDGESNIVVWREGSTMRAARLLATGAVVPAGGIDLSGPVLTANAAPTIGCSTSLGCLIGWTTNPAPYDVQARGLAVAPGAPLEEGVAVRLSDENSYPYRLAIAAGEQAFLAVWEGGGPDMLSHIRASLVDASGELVRSSPIEIATQDPSDTSHQLVGVPSVASSGSEFLTTWLELAPAEPGCDTDVDPGSCMQTDLVGARLLDDGTVVDGPGDRVHLDATFDEVGTPSLTWTGRSYLALWSARFACNAQVCTEARVVRVSRGGTIVDSPAVSVGASDADDANPVAALGDSGSVLVAYHRYDEAPGYGSRRVAIRLVNGDDTADDWAEPPVGCCQTSQSQGMPLGATLLSVAVGAALRRRRCRRRDVQGP